MSVKDGLIGAKGGGSTFRNRPDNLRSTDTFEALIGLCAGRIKGLAPGGLNNLMVDGVPIEDGSGNTTLKDFNAVLFKGDPAILEPIKLQLGGSSGAETVNLPLNNANNGSPGDFRFGTVPQSGVDYIDLRFVVGSLYRQDKKGIYDATASIEIQLQPSGSSTWINPLQSLSAPTYNQNGIALSGVPGMTAYILRSQWDDNNTSMWADPAPGYLQITGKTTQAYVKEIRIAVPNTGAYANKTWSVRARLIERDSYTQDENQESRQIQWESIAGVSMAPIGGTEAWRGLAYLQINGKASDQLTGIPTIEGIYDFSEVRVPPNSVWNPETRVYTGAAWDGATEQIAWTRCPAFQMKDLIEDDLSGISALVPGSTMNKWDVLEASKWFAQLVPDGKGGQHPRYSMNYILDQALSVNDVMQYAAGAVGAYTWDEGDGNWRLVVEKPENATALFTKENIVGEFQYAHTDLDSRYNDIIGVYRDEDRNYEENRVRVFDQDHIDNYGRRATSVALVGCTNRQEALRRVKIRQLSSLNEIRQVTFTTNRQGNLVQPFSVVLVADGDLASDTTVRTTGRLVSRTSGVLTVRDTMRLEVGVAYKVHVTIPNPAYNPNSTAQPGDPDWRKPTVTVSRTVTNTAGQRGDVKTLNISSALPANTPVNAPVALEAIGLPTLPKQYRVMSVEPQDDELVVISAIEIYTPKWAESDAVSEDAILAQTPNKTIPVPGVPSGGMFSVKTFEAEFQTKRVLTVRWERPGSIWIEGFKVEYNLNNGAWVTLTERALDNYVELQQPQNGIYTFRITTLDRRGGASAPLVGTYELTDTPEDYAPVHTRGALASRPVTGGREGDKYTTTDQNPNLTYIWSAGQWHEESNFVTGADQIEYTDGTKVEDLKPAQPGADVTGNNTAADTVAVGGRPATDILDQLDSIGEGSFDVTPPSTPTGLTLSSTVGLDSDNTQVSYLTAQFNPSPQSDTAGYVLEVKETSTGIPVEYTITNTQTRFPARGGVQYFVRVKAFDKSGNYSTYSTVVSTTTVKDTTAPGVPTNLVAQNALTSIFLTWDNDAALDLAAVSLYENTTNNSGTATFVARIPTMPGVKGAFTRTGLPTAATRYYWLKSVDTSGNVSTFSAVASATTASLVYSDFTAGLAPPAYGASLPNPTGYTGTPLFYNTANGKFYRYSGGAWVANVAATDISGTLTNAQIADLAAAKLTGQITSTQITDDAITTPKIAAGAVIANSLAAGSVIASKIVVSDGSNMIPDSNLTDPASWFPVVGYESAFTFVPSSTGAASANYMRINASSNAVRLSTAAIPVEGGSPYYAQGIGVPSNVNTTVSLHLTWFSDAAGTTAITDTIISFKNTLFQSTPIDRAGVSVIAPTNAKSVRYYVTRLAGGTGYATFAEPILRRAMSSELIVDGSIISAKLQTGAVTADKVSAGAISAVHIAANAIVASKLAVGDTQQLNSDVTFKDASYWANTGVYNAPLNLSPSSSGSSQGWFVDSPSLNNADIGIQDAVTLWASALTPPGAGRQHLYSNFIRTVQPGVTYELSATAYNISNQDIVVLARFYDSSDVVITDMTLVFPVGPTAIKKIQAVAPATARSVQFIIYNAADSTYTGYARVGNLQLTRATGTTLIESGAITTEKMVVGSINADRLLAASITTPLLAAGAITADKISIGAQRNLKTNNFFPSNLWDYFTPMSTVDPVGGATFNANNASSSTHVWLSDYPGPFGVNEPVMFATSANNAGGSGGFTILLNNAYGLDKNRSYRYSIWFKTDVAGGNIYHGTGSPTSPVRNAATGAVDNDPYFFVVPATSLTPNKWYLLVGVVRGQSYANTVPTDQSGIWDPVTAQRVFFGNDFRWGPSSTDFMFRSYQYFAPAGARNFFASPRIEELNGDSGSVLSLLNSASVTAMINAGTTTIDGGKLTTGTVTAVQIAAATITGTQIAANTIAAGHLQAGSVDATKITVTNLASINSNLGAITAGSININNKFIVASDGTTTIQSAASGERLSITSQAIKVYDSGGNVTVQIGNLAV